LDASNGREARLPGLPTYAFDEALLKDRFGSIVLKN
jgi:hypothetical protein